MTFYTFRLLSPEVQLHYPLHRGTYLAQRWQNEYASFNPCYILRSYEICALPAAFTSPE